MSLKIVNEYITEVLQLESFKKELERAKTEHEVQPVSPSSNTNPDEQRNPDQRDSKNEEEKNLALLLKLSAGGDPDLESLLNQTR